MTSEENYDEILFPILCNEGNIFGFFDKIFDFLYRRTDYFKIKKEHSSDLGLEPGEAENIIRSVFCKYMEQSLSQYKLEKENTDELIALDYIAEEVVSTTEPDSSKDVDAPNTEPDSSKDIDAANIEPDSSKDVHASTTEPDSNKVVQASTKPASSEEAKEADKLDEQSEPKIPWMDPDCYNGARYEDYSWAQTIKDIDIRLKVPKHVTSGKQVKVSIYQSSINTEILLDGKWKILKKGDFRWKINVEESTWVLVPGEHIHIYLQKLQQLWWDSCFVEEPKIDMKSIDSSMPYEDLDEESRAKISELMYNQHQKRLGKPTIQQNKIQNILKESWDCEGSPFKGQPFDPSIVDIQSTDNL